MIREKVGVDFLFGFVCGDMVDVVLLKKNKWEYG